MSELLYYALDGCTAQAALAKFAGRLAGAGEERYGLLAAAADYRLVRLGADGVIEAAPEERGDLDSVYELRAFGADGELRWLHEGAGVGQAVLLSEVEQDGLGEPARQAVAEPIEQEYILWGQGTDQAKPGWSLLSAAQIGSRWAPVEGVPPSTGRVILKAVEYVAVGDHGNAFVTDERLVGLEVRNG